MKEIKNLLNSLKWLLNNHLEIIMLKIINFIL